MPARKVEAVPELDADDYWNEIVSENVVPPMKVKGIVLEQPTVTRMDLWREAGVKGDGVAGEKALFGDNYEAIKNLFKDEPEYRWENFNRAYLRHMFGVDGDDLKG
ncbi:MAG: hypothetical protein A4E20_10850 [Nitrospira sp. SG-bin2]|uniref:hypothetical protein n=1 Tax=Nitrospira cf. moscoviensis SBR1015 TaxID=96242 RepID=UPI000A0BF04F|nr:hypothetical protein [Nitrospira cf. moscoviensis SBR1015]OQW34510.1 MAG: hypothetical protein A4E20_10850 [Nitrospira sp. SG-bin2]